MIWVFSGFVLGDDPTVKMVGLGLASAVLIDATLVRMVLVPATMVMFDEANWWLPAWLDRLLPHVDIEGERLVARLAAEHAHDHGPAHTPGHDNGHADDDESGHRHPPALDPGPRIPTTADPGIGSPRG
ncbi:MAG: hypothetical protein ACR2HR_08700 [Euzebya sp.]